MSKSHPTYSRQDWVQRSQFLLDDNARVLNLILDRIDQSFTEGLYPTVIFDLDSTLYDTCPRTQKILNDWLEDRWSARPEWHWLMELLKDLPLQKIGYSLFDTFALAGIPIDRSRPGEWEAPMKDLKSFWRKRFFSNHYLQHDTVDQAGVKFAQKVFDRGAQCIYLTGRDWPCMGKKTLERLRQDGFPIDHPKTRLRMKPAREDDDFTYKMWVAKHELTWHQNIVASFENEPVNLVALREVLPGAMHVFVDTHYSDRSTKIVQGLYRITGFHSD